MTEIKALDVLRELIEKSRHEYEMGNVSYVVGFNVLVKEYADVLRVLIWGAHE